MFGSSSFQLVRRFADRFGLSLRRAQSSEGVDPFMDALKLAKPEVGDAIFDVGANCGQTIQILRQHFPHAPIHAFEPIGESFETARRRSSELQNVKLVNAAVGAARSKVVIYSTGTSELASLRDISSSNGKVANSVEIIPLDAYTSESNIKNIYLLKTDTEGYDLDVFKGAEALLKQGKIKLILTEVGFTPKDERHTYFPDVTRVLEEHNYTFANLYDIAGFWHLKPYQCTYANALFIRRDLLKV
jgi:FkbM family methyltransferase